MAYIIEVPVQRRDEGWQTNFNLTVGLMAILSLQHNDTIERRYVIVPSEMHAYVSFAYTLI
jgi:hypothetical protein